MRIPLSWLKEFVPFDLTEKGVADLLTLAGLEVDKIEPTPFSFEGVVVAEIQETSPHPNADQLKIVQVFDGKERLQIVCGDPKCAIGMKVALAHVGATLNGQGGNQVKIKKSKLRGIDSFGMLCSEEELGLSESSQGILILEKEAEVGANLKTLLGDVVLEISLTPNLGRCLSVLGVARELAALLDQTIHIPPIAIEKRAPHSSLTIEIDDPNDCFSYSCQKISGIEVGPAPKWMQERLKKGGIRSINGIVDVTNYVMLELGHPLHAFDAKKVAGQRLQVKSTKESLSFKTLDGKIREIPENTLMIWDSKSPLAIAGIMGGAHSEVDETTTEIILEAAHFNPSTIRKGSKGLSLRSESSIRFERGVDGKTAKIALDRATALILSMAKGAFAEPRVDEIAKEREKSALLLRPSRVNQILGTELSLKDIQSLLNRLEMETQEEGKALKVQVPSYRTDIEGEIDLIEEVARLYGYNEIPKREERISPSDLPHSPLYQLKKAAVTCLIASGLQEILTCDLISPDLAQLAIAPPSQKREAIPVLRPSCADQSILRTSLLPGMLQVAKYNIDRQAEDFCAFELGKIYFKEGSKECERLTAGILLTGKRAPSHWEKGEAEVDFFDLKGSLEMFFKGLNASLEPVQPTCLPHFHPQIQGEIFLKGCSLALLGEVHPSVLKKFGIEKKVLYAEIDLEGISFMPHRKKKMTPLPQFPGSTRDWTFICHKGVPVGNILDAIRSFPSKLLKRCEFLTLYESEKIGNNQKSCTFRLTYRNDAQTIQQPQVEKEHARLTEEITKKFGNFID